MLCLSKSWRIRRGLGLWKSSLWESSFANADQIPVSIGESSINGEGGGVGNCPLTDLITEPVLQPQKRFLFSC